MKDPHRNVCVLTLATILVLGTPATGQIGPDEHAKHHPQPGTANPAAGGNAAGVAPGGRVGGGMGPGMGAGMGGDQSAAGGGPEPGRMGPPAGVGPPGGMGGGMDEMMNKMGTPPPKELYPLLMDVPDLLPEQRAEVEQLAHERMKAGTARLSSGLEKLAGATSDDDYSAMQQATEHMRQGLAQFESGLAAHRALSEGQVTRNVALQWFKREMNLASPIPRDELHALLGITPFHLFTMGLLIVFALAMVAMYFFKMRRAAALFGRLDPGSGPPPPGASPPLAGAPGPSAPPAGGKPQAGGTPPPAAPPSPPTPPAAPGGGDAAKIAGRADELWQARGRPLGSPEIDWVRAEEELAKVAEKPAAPPAAGGSLPSPAAPPAEKSPPPTPSPAAPAASAPSREESSAIPVPTASSAPPLTANWRGQLRVGSIVTETPSVKTFRLLPLSNDGLLPFTFVPGQFLNVAFWIGGARMNRSYSISSSPTQRDYVELTVRREPRGAVSRHINDLLKVGDQIEAGGPVGKFTFTGTEADSIVLVSGGVGITPMMSITRYLTERAWAGDIFFIYTCRTPADFIFADEVAALQRRNPKLRVAVTISKAEGTDWKGARGRITKEWLTQTVPDLASRRIHLCGPPAMMDTTKALLAEIGVPPDRVKTEAFGAPKPTPAAAGTTAKPTAPATGPLVTFSKNNKSANIRVDLQTGDSPPKQSILELSEELGIGIDFSCRVGTCGLCKVKLTSGEVEMAVQDALDADDTANNIILACQAKPKGEVTVEA
ncbi:2Fe-2S iron-sulfur cluster-binding protein [Nitrospira lenta]|uniref:Oxidoreductase FAD-binding subunit n=1 Tax=Nitrospira lenta TaxID=1436998 RepID=A0A330LAM9_9BACT|nr:2Fe-2S iron-sulfur cluster-binding protein [Nitrospira lenta]SPP66362.1 Oxidoreductase FAD-binding subunit [Nitrospira lenta]